MAMTTIEMPFAVRRPILACGADIKGAFCVAKGRRAFLGSGFGDLADLDNFERYERAIRRALRKFRPHIIVCDLHPGYVSSRFAQELERSLAGSRLVHVQHHEAHVASALLDHGIRGPVIGVAFDGTGYGADGTFWGGEFFTGDARRQRRAAHLAPVPMPGGDAAVREPWRLAAAYLYQAFGPSWTGRRTAFTRRISSKQWERVREMIDRSLYAPLTSSAGRLFDAAGSIILAKLSQSAEAEVPVALERIADAAWADSYDFDLVRGREGFVLDSRKVFRGIVRDLRAGIAPAMVAGSFHNTVAEMIARTCLAIRKRHRLKRVVLTGGVFQNRLLTERALFRLGVEGFEVFSHARVSTNDTGIPIGQVAIARARSGRKA